MHAHRGSLILAIAFSASLVVVGCGDDSSDDETATTATAVDTTAARPPDTSTTATSSSTPTSTPTSTTGSTSPAVQPETAVWPFASSATRFTDPVAAATSFATDYLGFASPAMGAFQQGDSRSGEVEVRARADGPVTVVFVRQLTDDDSWWVLGCTSPNIQLTSPEALAAISSPVTLVGQSTAFEANVNVEIRQDGSTEPLAQDFVMGGSMGEMGPFSKAIAFDPPTAAAGAVVLRTFSMKDGATDEAAVLRVTFAG